MKQNLQKLEETLNKAINLFDFSAQQSAFDAAKISLSSSSMNLASVLKSSRSFRMPNKPFSSSSSPSKIKETQEEILQKMKHLNTLKGGFGPGKYFVDQMERICPALTSKIVEHKGVLILNLRKKMNKPKSLSLPKKEDSDLKCDPKKLKDVKESCIKVREFIDGHVEMQEEMIGRLNNNLKQYLYFCQVLVKNRKEEEEKLTSKGKKRRRKNTDSSGTNSFYENISIDQIDNQEKGDTSFVDLASPGAKAVHRRRQSDLYRSMKDFENLKGQHTFQKGGQGQKGFLQNANDCGTDLFKKSLPYKKKIEGFPTSQKKTNLDSSFDFAEFRSSGPGRQFASPEESIVGFDDGASQVHSTAMGAEFMTGGFDNSMLSSLMWKARIMGSGMGGAFGFGGSPNTDKSQNNPKK